METPRIKKIKSINLTPFRSPSGVASGKRALHSYQKQRNKEKLREFKCSAHSPYPPSLAALLSSRIDRYKRICPNLGNDFEQKIGLSPVVLAFNSPKEHSKSKLEIQSSFLESVLSEDKKLGIITVSNDLYSENQRMIQLIIDLSSNWTQKNQSVDIANISERLRQTQILSRKLSTNLHQMHQNLSPSDYHDPVVDELRTENDILKGKLSIYQKQIETMNENENVPVDANEAVRYLKTKLDRSQRQVEESKELVNMLRTALSDSIQERISLEETAKANEAPQDHAPLLEVEQVESVVEGVDIEEDEGVMEETEEKLDQGEYDETLAEEYKRLYTAHKAEAKKEHANLMLRKAEECSDGASFDNDVDYPKMNLLLEESFLTPSTNLASQHRIEEYIAGTTLEIKTQPLNEEGVQQQKVNSANPPPIKAEQPSTLSWFLETTGLKSKPELHSAVLIF